MSISAVEFKALRPARTTNKYGAKKVVIDGERFASKKEGERWKQLRLLETAGRIRNLKRQVWFAIRANEQLICRYVADFYYEVIEKDRWKFVVEDVKGMKSGVPYQLFKLKKRLMKVLHGIEILET